jgi:cystathionine gamma-synthase
MAAIGAIFQALQPGDHVIIPDDIYFGTRKRIVDLLGRWGLLHSEVDLTDLTALEAAFQPATRIVFVETPSNPMLKITDLRRVADVSHAHGALCVCDATWPTPILQRSLELGADLVAHSTTKYLGGHSDLTGGGVITREENAFFERIIEIQHIGGAVPSPFDCWLLLRGIRTLPYRMRAHCENAQQVAEFLAHHPNVKSVNYPGLASHPQHAIAAGQMSAFGGMISFHTKGGEIQAAEVAASTRLFAQATSLGGIESLIEHRAVVEGPLSRTPRDLLRLSVGLEHPDDLLADLDQALQASGE